MKASAPILLIVVAVVGFTSGVFIDGELSPHTLRIPNITMSYLDNSGMTFIQSAHLSSQGQAIIDHATIDFGFDTLTNEEGYFENVLNECIFSSGESFGGNIFSGDEESADNGVCIICKIKGECKNVDADFIDLPHGTRLGKINSDLAVDGIFLSVDARTGGHDTAIIFDGNTAGDLDEDPTPDPDLRKTGICSGCEDLKMLIIPENIDDDDFDNLVDSPDDSASGGTMKFQFGLPRKVVSFDFVDMDRPSAAVHEARAYSDFSCTQLIDSQIPNSNGAVPIPNGADGNVQTIIMPQVIQDADVLCLEIEAHDSFGVTNLVLECPRIFMDGNILGVGRKNLPGGYTANERIHLPMDPPLSVFDPQAVAIEILSSNLNYHGLNHGDVLNSQFLGAYGIKISGNVTTGNGLEPRDPVVFDTELSGTRDSDLEVDVGNISIVQENTQGCEDGTCDLPDDNAAGGEQYFQFNPKRYINSLVWVDADRAEPFGTIFLYSNYDCTGLLDSINIPFKGDGSVQVLVPINIEKVGCMVADYTDSGGLSKLNLGCPLPEDPITMPWFKGEHQGSTSQESIYFTGFPNDPSDDPNEGNQWTLENQYHVGNGHYFGILQEPQPQDPGEWSAYASGAYVLAGWGSFSPDVSYIRTAIDISNHHNVVVSVQYNYEDTESADAFFFEYKDGATWMKIVDVESPNVSPGQLGWTLAEANIPDSIDSLELRFTWTTSSGSEHVMIDNLEIFGIPN